MQQNTFRIWPLALFVLIAYGIVWVLIGLSFIMAVPFTPLLVIGSWAPDISAFIVIGLVLREKGGIRTLLGRWLRWGFPAVWYGASLSALALAFLSLPVLRLFGVELAGGQPFTLGAIGSLLVIEIVTGATGEELGWRGFLQLRLQDRLSPLLSGVVVGVIWAAFHVPLWLLHGGPWASLPYWAFALAAVSSSVIFAWLVNGAGGSMVIATLFHFLFNLAVNLAIMLGAPAAPFYTVYAVAFTAFAIPVGISMEVSRVRRRGEATAR